MSGIRFPGDLRVLETFDNTEFITCGAFTLSKENLQHFEKNLAFEQTTPNVHSSLNYYLKDSANYFFSQASIVHWGRCYKCA
ncbi:MAG: hypothetical protein H0U95_03160 [Bacteroidetes bacterium]|nr:hypothetical protein [Bacteroidota bacterium]